MFTKILLPLDGSTLSERAIPVALALARREHGHIVLMRVPLATVMPAPIVVNDPTWIESDLSLSNQQQAQTYLTDLMRRFECPDFSLSCKVVFGDIAAAIVDTAAQCPADLIVMSTHGYSGFTRWLLGSVTERVLRAAPCPVLAVHDSHPIRKILVALDGSMRAETTLAPAIAIARQFEATLVLLHAVEPMDVPSADLLETTEPHLWRRLRDWSHDEGDHYLKETAEGLRKQGLQVETVLSYDGPADAILEAAEAHAIDLIALATHGRTGLARWVYGSVTEKVLRSTQRSLLVVRTNQTPPDD